jgi:hypothetical protein
MENWGTKSACHGGEEVELIALLVPQTVRFLMKNTRGTKCVNEG